MTMVTAIVGLALLGLGGCGKSDEPADEPTTSASQSPTASATPTTEPTSDAAGEIVGDWQDTEADWTVHFHDDGTYVEDFQGVTDFRVGKYTVDGTTVSLVGDDGNTDAGKIEGETLVFKLGTLTRK
jgi:hypothetical protein